MVSHSGSNLGVKALSPVLYSRNVEASLALYEALGFKVTGYRSEPDGPMEYGFANYGGGDFHLTLKTDLQPEASTSHCYFWVEDADAVYQTWKAAGVPGKFTSIEDRPYGMRDFSFRDPDGNLVCVGMMLAGAEHVSQES